jgi:dipeptidyl aminopeptidase/acylaminoacyl peptidase
MSADGLRTAYRDIQDGRLVIHVAEGGRTTSLAGCEGCLLRAFFPGAADALVEAGDRLLRHRLDGGGQVLLAQVPRLVDAALSPDGRRLAFTQAKEDGTAALYTLDVARALSPPDSWRLVAEDRNYVGSPVWSPDGSRLYYVSQRDGSPCVWVQPIAANGRLAGPAAAALHLHAGNGVFGRSTLIGATADRLFVLLTRFKGDVWAIDLER